MSDDKLLTVEQVADRLQVHSETVRRWLRSGELEGMDLGHRVGYRIRESDLERFIEERAKKAVA